MPRTPPPRTPPSTSSSTPSKELEVFPNPTPGRDYLIHMEIPEFTCLCPKTGQPDFATLILDYIPEKKCVELKSLKLYIWSYRNEGAFHEAVTNRIVDDLVAALKPRYLRLIAKFYVRGGIFTTVVAEHRKPDWKPLPSVELGRFERQSSTRG
jgi:7-cyano-7-deazaguanine reductase